MPWDDNEKKFGFQFKAGGDDDAKRKSLDAAPGGPLNVHRSSWWVAVLGHRMGAAQGDVVTSSMHLIIFTVLDAFDLDENMDGERIAFLIRPAKVAALIAAADQAGIKWDKAKDENERGRG